MGVEGNHELTRSYGGPNAAIDTVFGPDHPTQIEVEPFASATLRGRRKEVPHSDTPFQFTARVKRLMPETGQELAEMVKGRPRVHIGFRQSGAKGALDRSVCLKRSSQYPQQNRQVPAGVKPVIEPSETLRVSPDVEIRNGL
jgi:hypothetical protein